MLFFQLKFMLDMDLDETYQIKLSRFQHAIIVDIKVTERIGQTR
jgi:hypothetical protein